MALKFRRKNKNYYKIIITILICLLLGFLYLGNYNLRERLENNDISGNDISGSDISGNSEAAIYRKKRAKNTKEAKIAISSTGGNNGSDGYNTQIQAFTLAQNLEGKNTFLNDQ
jgi:hypothetical protein